MSLSYSRRGWHPLLERLKLAQVMRQAMPDPGAGDGPPPGWSAERLADGGQAVLFRVRANAGHPLGVIDDEPAGNELVVKLYRCDGPEAADVVRDEFDSLRRLHARLDATTIHRWRVRCPRPLFMCEETLALVMTPVPGVPLSTWLRTPPPPAVESALDSLPAAIVAGLTRYWAGEPRLYGDIRFNNILFDPSAGCLSFLDPGKADKGFECDGVPREWYPASRDLAYLLFSAAVAIKSTLTCPGARMRQLRLAREVVSAFVGTFRSASRRASLLREIEGCARAHLEMIPTSSSPPKALWRRFVRRTGARSIARALDQLSGATPAGAEAGIDEAFEQSLHLAPAGLWPTDMPDD